MSKEILIAGSGFMGTSMAHALENCNITCFETNEAYLATLKNLNIYKNIFSDVSDIKGEFDLIIICTRQKDVLEHISYFSSKFPESLITDISSSKNFLQEADLPPNFISFKQSNEYKLMFALSFLNLSIIADTCCLSTISLISLSSYFLSITSF